MLKYIGNKFLPGIPARDLSDEEVKQFGGEKILIATGLYEAPKKERVSKKEEGEKWQE
jgi:hypothetical protein